MKILVDENIPLIAVGSLRSMGHDVRDIRGTVLEGIGDNELWKIAQREERLLITTDKGFASYRTAGHHGVLLIRLRQPNRRRIHQRIMQAMARFHEEDWAGLLVVMRDTSQSTWRTNADRAGP